MDLNPQASAAVEKLIEPEIEAVRIVLEGKGRRAVVLAMTVDDSGTGLLARAYSQSFTKVEGLAIADQLVREAKRLRDLVMKPNP